MNDQRDEFERLVQGYLDGTLGEEAAAPLNERLRTDREARDRFVQWLNLDSALADLAEREEAGAEIAESEFVPGSAGGVGERVKKDRATFFTNALNSNSRRAVILSAAASVTLLAGVAGWWWTGGGRAKPAPAEVVSAAGAEEFFPGQHLQTRTYTFDSGAVELATPEGARIAIEAPAAFRFDSAMRLRLMRGRVAAEVPLAARGFTLETPDGQAVDLGTRFGVDVGGEGASEVHVFEGEVVARAAGRTGERSLRQGEAVAMEPGGSAARDLRSSAFIQPEEVTDLTAGLAAGQRDRSEELLRRLRRDPALIALLDFENGESRPGTYRLVQGRWPGSRAPEFVHEDDHLKLDAGGERDWPQLTLAAWVRIDKLGAPYQSLLHTDDWRASKPGQVHWMITRNTTMRLALHGNTLAPSAEEEQGYPDSRTPVLPDRGRWMHLAAVYDSVAGTVRFYHNGRFDKETRQAVAHPAKLGPAQIGNWNQRDRRLSGRVDELLLLGRAMGDAEIRELHDAGTPYLKPSSR